MSAAIDDDAQWFRKHPKEQVRKRRITWAELQEFRHHGGEGNPTHVEVHQGRPGIRSRMPYHPTKSGVRLPTILIDGEDS